MTALYKLTDANDRTYNDTQWGENTTRIASGKGELCGPGWIHAYTDPLLAVLLNPIHANFEDPHLWEAEGEVGKTDHGLKVGCTSLTTIRRMEMPVISTAARVRFGILCAMEVCEDEACRAWAARWLDGTDRDLEAAWAAEAAAEAAADAAEAAAWAAVWAAEAAARAAVWAARAAARAARAAARDKTLPLADLARRAIADEAEHA